MAKIATQAPRSTGAIGFPMSRATEMRSIAKGLVALETPRRGSSATKSPAGFRVAEKLRPHLANLMGDGGYRALLARALALASAEVSWLGAVRVKTDGSFEKFSQAVNELQEKMGISSKTEYERLRRASEEWRVHSEQARLALEQHVAAHNC
jgi:hypothetical protein